MWVSVAISPDRAGVAQGILERVVCRDATVVLDAVNFAMGIVQVLRIHWDISLVSVGEIEEACLVKYDAASKVTTTFPSGTSYDKLLLIHRSVSFQLESKDGGSSGAVGEILRIRNVNPAIFCIVGMHSNVQETCLIYVVNCG